MALANFKLKIGSLAYPLYTDLEDIKGTYDKVLKVEKDGKIYYARLMGSDKSVDVSDNGNFPHLTGISRSVPANGSLKATKGSEVLYTSNSEFSWKTAECEGTTTWYFNNCEYKFWYSWDCNKTISGFAKTGSNCDNCAYTDCFCYWSVNGFFSGWSPTRPNVPTGYDVRVDNCETTKNCNCDCDCECTPIYSDCFGFRDCAAGNCAPNVQVQNCYTTFSECTTEQNSRGLAKYTYWDSGAK